MSLHHQGMPPVCRGCKYRRGVAADYRDGWCSRCYPEVRESAHIALCQLSAAITMVMLADERDLLRTALTYATERGMHNRECSPMLCMKWCPVRLLRTVPR